MEHPAVVGQADRLAADGRGDRDRGGAGERRAGGRREGLPRRLQADMVGGAHDGGRAERHDLAASDIGQRETGMGAADIDRDDGGHWVARSSPSALGEASPDVIAASIALAPFFRPVRTGAEHREQFAARARGRRRGVGGDARGPFGGIDDRVELAGVGAQPDHVAVAHFGQRAAAKRFGARMDRAGDLAARPRHPSVGDERDAEAAILEHAERRRQFCGVRACRWRGAPGNARRRRRRGRAPPP